MRPLLVFVCYFVRICLLLDKNGPNVCVRKNTRSSDVRYVVIECCPDYFEQDDICHECPAGKYGRKCEAECITDKYGRMCKLDCNCGPREHCNPVVGCICDAGFTGEHCNSECETGKHGVNCSQTCDCTGSCDHVTGKCTKDSKENEMDETQKEQENDGLNWVIVFILLTNAGVFICIASVAAFAYVMRRKWCKVTTQNENIRENGHDETNLYYEIVEDQVGIELPVLNREEDTIETLYYPHPKQDEDGPHTLLNNAIYSISSVEDVIGPLAKMDTTSHSTLPQEDLTGPLHHRPVNQ